MMTFICAQILQLACYVLLVIHAGLKPSWACGKSSCNAMTLRDWT